MNKVNFSWWPAGVQYELRPPEAREAYVFTSCCFTALHTKHYTEPMHEVLLKVMPRVPLKWFSILDCGATSGCEVTSEVYKLLLTSIKSSICFYFFQYPVGILAFTKCFLKISLGKHLCFVHKGLCAVLRVSF